MSTKSGDRIGAYHSILFDFEDSFIFSRLRLCELNCVWMNIAGRVYHAGLLWWAYVHVRVLLCLRLRLRPHRAEALSDAFA